MKPCNRCGTETDNFARSTTSLDGLQAWCRECMARRQRERLAATTPVSTRRTRTSPYDRAGAVLKDLREAILAGDPEWALTLIDAKLLEWRVT